MWDRQSIEYLKNTYNLKTLKDLATDLDRSIASIKHKVCRLGLSERTLEWSEEELEILTNYRKIATAKDISIKLGRTVHAVQTQAQRLGLKSSQTENYEGINHSYFNNLNTKQKAYILGLLAADGCITGNNRIVISLKCDDSDVLEFLRSELAPKHKIYTSKNPTGNDIRIFCFSSSRICQDLNKYGLGRRKSMTLEWPKLLPNNLEQLFLLGYHDGDGSSNKGKRNKWSLVGTYSFLQEAKKIIDKNLAINLYGPKAKSNCKEMFYIETSDNKALLVDSWLHTISRTEIPWIKRKTFMVDSN